MEADQAQSMEADLWDVLRTLEDRTHLLREMALQARAVNEVREADLLGRKITVLEEDIAVVRKLLAGGSRTEPGPKGPRKTADSSEVTRRP